MTDAEAGDTQGEALLLQNLAVLLPALRVLGIRRAEVTYAGSRGRCNRCEVTALPVDALARLRETPVVFRRRAADAGQPSVETFADTLPLSEALQRFTLFWAGLKFGYWQRADGGRGIMRIDVDDGALTLEHDALLVESYHATLRG